MKQSLKIIIVFFLSFSCELKSQTIPFRENSKWGIKENGANIVQPIYDTIFNFDSTGRICMACFLTKGVSANKFIKTYTTVSSCNYFNRSGDILVIQTDEADTCSVFTLGRTSVRQYNDNSDYFILTSKRKKYLIRKDFVQSIHKGYNEIYLKAEPQFVITEIKNETEKIFTGLINLQGETIIPHNYSGIKINTKDSLIVACSAGIVNNGDDDIYDYTGKKIASYKRHVDMATKNFVIHKIFEPKQYYILLNVETKQTTNFNADELQPFEKDKVLLRIKDDWFIFDLESKQKTRYKTK